MQDEFYGMDEASYGDSYREHFFTQYNDFVASAESISQKRVHANGAFLGVNSAVIALAGYLQFADGSSDSSKYLAYTAIGIVGIVVCYAWYRLILAYKNLNSAKFSVILKMEKQLPVRCYDAEWRVLTSDDQYAPLGQFEKFVPLALLGVHAIVTVSSAYLACTS